jgi:kumamolisin
MLPRTIRAADVQFQEEISMSLNGGAVRHLNSLLSLAVVVALVGFAQSASAQGARSRGTVTIPASSIERPGDAGVRAHTNFRIFVPSDGPAANQNKGAKAQQVGPPFPGYFFETPASLACVYSLVAQTPGCNPNVVTTNPSGGSRAIAIVDAFDYPQAASDLAFFSTQFGVAPANFTVVYADGVEPPEDSTGGWEIEEALDIEWSHSMAPNAKLFLVEAASNYNSDLFKAIGVAAKLVAANGGGEISMSWGEGEFANEASYDTHFSKTTGIVYFASSGDGPGVIYPSASPYVVAAGGTSTSRNNVTGSFQASTAWQETGGGISAYEPQPSYQAGVSSLTGLGRGTPDISFEADPETPVWVYTTFFGVAQWYIVGGTSVASPSLAGVINTAGGFAATSNAELTTIYGNLGNTSAFTDITSGSCGVYESNLTVGGYDLCTGVGAPSGYTGK